MSQGWNETAKPYKLAVPVKAVIHSFLYIVLFILYKYGIT